jgi:hypothetical protein
MAAFARLPDLLGAERRPDGNPLTQAPAKSNGEV